MPKTSNKSSKSTTSSDNASEKVAPVYRYKEIDFSSAAVSELNKDGMQPLAYINYNDPVRKAETKLLVQSGKIKLVAHGIPGLHDEYVKDDSAREFIKIPLDPQQAACVELRKFLEAVDEWAGSAEMRKTLFKGRADKYQYQSAIKTPKPADDDDDDDDNKKKSKKGKSDKKYPIYDFVKMKFNMDIQGKGRTNKTKLKRKEGTTSKVIKADTITEIANQIKFQSEIRFVFYMVKIWANKTAASGAVYIPYGVGFKLMAVEFTPGQNKGIDVNSVDLLSDEDEDEAEVKKPAKKSSKKTNSDDEEEVKKSSSKKSPKVDDSDDDQSNDESKSRNDSDDDAKPNSDNESDDDSKKKSKGKKSKKSSNDSDDDITITKSSKKDKKKSKKTADSDEEEADSEEEVKPKSKSSKEKSSSKSKN